MKLRHKFSLGDLVRYRSGGDVGFVVAYVAPADSDRKGAPQLSLLPTYFVRWFKPYDTAGSEVWEDEIYEKDLELLSSAK